MNGDASGVRVEIELAPNLNLEGVSTPPGLRSGAELEEGLLKKEKEERFIF